MLLALLITACGSNDDDASPDTTAAGSDGVAAPEGLPFDGILGSLEAGRCDVVGSAVTITDECAQQVDR